MNSETMLQHGWKFFSCSKSDLNINFVLGSGQCFRWKENDGIWTGILGKKVWQLQQGETKTWYKVLNQSKEDINDKAIENRKRKSNTKKTEDNTKVMKLDENCNQVVKHKYSSEVEILRDYFQLQVDLILLCKNWSKFDIHFKNIYQIFPGVRMLRQDPVENLFCFICSSNNNITRISSMVEKMCTTFGDVIHCSEIDKCYAFPTIENLVKPNTESVLRNLGFGYRAKYIHQTALRIKENGGETWLRNLRNLSYDDAHSELVKLTGIGAKVADCVCMMSLDKPEAIPVDTHVWQIAVRDYKITSLKNTKTLTATSYKAIGEFFRNLWGPYASWAMNFLFVADLKQFKQLVNERDKV